jgi:hypothetical protein
MTPDEHIAALFASLREFDLKLKIVMASDIPPRLKQYRIKLITREITAARHEVGLAVEALKRP